MIHIFDGHGIMEKDNSDTFDRYGGHHCKETGIFRDNGRFASPAGTPFPQRSLPPVFENLPLIEYEVIRPIPDVRTGRASPWFDQPGGGTQFLFPAGITDLIRMGFIRRKQVVHGQL